MTKDFHILSAKIALNLLMKSLFLNHLTAVSGVGSSPALATCETSQVLLAGVLGGFSRGFSKIYNKRDDFDFETAIFPILDGDVPRLYSQFIRFARVPQNEYEYMN